MKRIVTLGFIVILSFVLLVGCGGNNGAGGTDNNTGTASEPVNDSDGASNDASSGTEVAATLSPPAWLIGEWTPADPVLNNQDILVTNSNVVFNSGLLDIEWQIKNVGLAVEESLDGEVYTLSYETGDFTTTYIFNNQGNNTMVLRFGIGDTMQDMDFVKK